MRSLPAIIAWLACTGCDDVVTRRHPTLAEARLDGAVTRGWIPPFLPASSRAIVERNNLDLNLGTGTFDYDLEERSTYVAMLSGLGATSRPEGTSDILTITTNRTHWEIRLPRHSGSGGWISKPR